MTAEILQFDKPLRKGRGDGRHMKDSVKQDRAFRSAVNLGTETALSRYDESGDLWFSLNLGTRVAAEKLLYSFYSSLEFLSYAYLLAEVTEAEMEMVKAGHDIEKILKNYCLVLLRKIILESVQWRLKKNAK